MERHPTLELHLTIKQTRLLNTGAEPPVYYWKQKLVKQSATPWLSEYGAAASLEGFAYLQHGCRGEVLGRNWTSGVKLEHHSRGVQPIQAIASEENKDLTSILKSEDTVEEIRLLNRIQHILNICGFGIPNKQINEEIYLVVWLSLIGYWSPRQSARSDNFSCMYDNPQVTPIH